MLWVQKTILGIEWCYISINPIKNIRFFIENFNILTKISEPNKEEKTNEESDTNENTSDNSNKKEIKITL